MTRSERVGERRKPDSKLAPQEAVGLLEARRDNVICATHGVGLPSFALFVQDVFRTRTRRECTFPHEEVVLRKEAEMSEVWLRRGAEVFALVAALLLLTSLVEA
jgi:hypothetical protein